MLVDRERTTQARVRTRRARMRGCACPLLRGCVLRVRVRVRVRVPCVSLDSQTNEGVARAMLGLDTLRYLYDLFALALVPVSRDVAAHRWARRLKARRKRCVDRDARRDVRIHQRRRRRARRITCQKTTMVVTRVPSAPFA